MHKMAAQMGFREGPSKQEVKEFIAQIPKYDRDEQIKKFDAA